jgi:hypothetical protein
MKDMVVCQRLTRMLALAEEKKALRVTTRALGRMEDGMTLIVRERRRTEGGVNNTPDRRLVYVVSLSPLALFPRAINILAGREVINGKRTIKCSFP